MPKRFLKVFSHFLYGINNCLRLVYYIIRYTRIVYLYRDECIVVYHHTRSTNKLRSVFSVLAYTSVSV